MIQSYNEINPSIIQVGCPDVILGLVYVELFVVAASTYHFITLCHSPLVIWLHRLQPECCHRPTTETCDSCGYYAQLLCPTVCRHLLQ